MGRIRCGTALGLAVASALALSACGSHFSQSSSSAGSSTQSAPVQCGGKKKLLASGSTAQKNAIEQFRLRLHSCLPWLHVELQRKWLRLRNETVPP